MKKAYSLLTAAFLFSSLIYAAPGFAQSMQDPWGGFVFRGPDGSTTDGVNPAGNPISSPPSANATPTSRAGLTTSPAGPTRTTGEAGSGALNDTSAPGQGIQSFGPASSIASPSGFGIVPQPPAFDVKSVFSMDLPSFLGGKVNLAEVNYRAADTIVSQTNLSQDPNEPIIVTTINDVNRLETAAPLGRLISEHLASRFVQLGYNVTEPRLRRSLNIREGAGGEFILSRQAQSLSNRFAAGKALVGTYARSRNSVYVSLRMIDLANSQMVAAHDYSLPMTDDVRRLVGGAPAAAYASLPTGGAQGDVGIRDYGAENPPPQGPMHLQDASRRGPAPIGGFFGTSFLD